MKIYLAGGFRSGWQNRVLVACPQHEFLDPSSHKLEDPAAYTDWDLAAIRACDLVLGYMEKDNPGGYSLALEIGFAHGLGKPVMYVEEDLGPVRMRYFEMVREVASRTFSTLEDALRELEMGAGSF